MPLYEFTHKCMSIFNFDGSRSLDVITYQHSINKYPANLFTYKITQQNNFQTLPSFIKNNSFVEFSNVPGERSINVMNNTKNWLASEILVEEID